MQIRRAFKLNAWGYLLGRRAAEAEENHWPGFVDALSTIVMVVTFLLIILAIAIFILSQSVAKSYIDSQSQQTNMGGGDVNNSEPLDASSSEKGTVESEIVEGAAEAQTISEATAREDGNKSGGGDAVSVKSEFELNLGGVLMQEKATDNDTSLTVRSRDIQVEEERIAVASDEVPQETIESVQVKGSSSLITLEFDDVTTRIDEASAMRVQNFLHDNVDDRTGKIAVWSFAASTVGSISEAKRIAYYRGLSARNELMKNGFTTDQIEVHVRVGDTDDTKNLVRIILVP